VAGHLICNRSNKISLSNQWPERAVGNFKLPIVGADTSDVMHPKKSLFVVEPMRASVWGSWRANGVGLM